MEVKAEFSRETIDEIFSKMTINQLINVQNIYFNCDSQDAKSPRYVHFSSFSPIVGWDKKRWIPLKTSASEIYKFLEEEQEKSRIVEQHFIDHKDILKPIIKTVHGQMLIEKETGIFGGSIVMYQDSKGISAEKKRANSEFYRRNTINVFLLLIRALNNGDFGVGDRVTISIKQYPAYPGPCTRIKIVSHISVLEDVLLKVHQIFSDHPTLPKFYFKHKSHVATYLEQARLVRNFETCLAGSVTDVNDLVEKIRATRLEDVNDNGKG